MNPGSIDSANRHWPEANSDKYDCSKILENIIPNASAEERQYHAKKFRDIQMPASEISRYLEISREYGLTGLFDPGNNRPNFYSIQSIWEESVTSKMMRDLMLRIKMPTGGRLDMNLYWYHIRDLLKQTPPVDMRPYLALARSGRVSWKKDSEWFTWLYQEAIPLDVAENYLRAGKAIQPYTIYILHSYGISPDIYARYYSWVDEDKFFWNRNPHILFSHPQDPLIHEAQLRWRNKSLRVGRKQMSLMNNVHMIRSVLTFMREKKWNPANDTEWQQVLREYEKTLDVFIESDKNKPFDAVFLLRAEGALEDPNEAFKDVRLLKEVYRNKHRQVFDYSSVSGRNRDSIKSPDGFVAAIRAYAQKRPNEKILVSMHLHGSEDGTGSFSKWNFMPKHWQELANISPNITLDIDSCFSGAKFSDFHQASSLNLNSQNETARASHTAKHLDAYKDNAGDYNGDGKVSYNEARLYAMFNDNMSNKPTLIADPRSKGRNIRIAEALDGSSESAIG